MCPPSRVRLSLSRAAIKMARAGVEACIYGGLQLHMFTSRFLVSGNEPPSPPWPVCIRPVNACRHDRGHTLATSFPSLILHVPALMRYICGCVYGCGYICGAPREKHERGFDTARNAELTCTLGFWSFVLEGTRLMGRNEGKKIRLA